MHFTGLTFRPPFEARSLLLQVTTGCSHNKCAFCTMYRDVPFRVEPLEQVEEDLQEAAAYSGQITRVFLENGDPFALGADRLLQIADLIHQYLPKVETIAMYASIKNIIGKSDEELCSLRKAGINELNIGVESGLDEALLLMNKGYTADEAKKELLRLRAANISWGANIIFGSAGAGKGMENAKATAALLNATKPYLIFTGTVHADQGCPLYDDIKNGAFAEGTFGEYLDEEERFLSLLDLEGCYYFGLHPSNVVQLQGWLNRDREKLIQSLNDERRSLAGKLDQIPVRVEEGAIIR